MCKQVKQPHLTWHQCKKGRLVTPWRTNKTNMEYLKHGKPDVVGGFFWVVWSLNSANKANEQWPLRPDSLLYFSGMIGQYVNSHDFHINSHSIYPIAGVYIIIIIIYPIIRIPTKGGTTIPNIGSLDPGTPETEVTFDISRLGNGVFPFPRQA